MSAPRRGRIAVTFLASLLAAVVGGCGTDSEGVDPPPDPVRAVDGADSVSVTFTRDEAPVRVSRPAPAGTTPLEAALHGLVRGPTDEESRQGIRSWFRQDTADVLRSATVDGSGRAVVDFEDLPARIPGASSSTGGMLLLLELNGTVFSIPQVRSVEYRLEGSCAAFWEWLQYDCRIVERGEPFP